MNTKTSKLLSVLLSLVMLLSLAGPLAPSARAEGPYKVGIDDIFNGNVTADKETANEGETVRLTVTPSEGYIIESISVYAIDLHSAVPVTYSEGNYVFTMPASEVQASATFRPAAPSTTEIPSVGLALTLPAAGGSYSGGVPAAVSVSSGTGFTVKEANWYDAYGIGPASFEAGEQYWAGILLAPAEGYAFTDDTAVTIDTLGVKTKEVVDYEADNNGCLRIATENYTIPAAAATTYTITVTGGTAHANEIGEYGDMIGAVITEAAEGDKVWLVADYEAVPEGKWAYGWTSEDVSISKGYNSFTMPAKPVTVAANYEDRVDKTYDLSSGTTGSLSDGDSDSINYLLNENLVNVDQDVSTWDPYTTQLKIDLDKDGSYDLTFRRDEGYTVLESNSVSDQISFTLTTPALWIKSVTFLFKAAAVPYTVDLSTGKMDLATGQEFADLFNSLGAWTHMSSTSGSSTYYYDLDKDGTEDISATNSSSSRNVLLLTTSNITTDTYVISDSTGPYNPITFILKAPTVTTYPVTLIAYDKTNGTEQAGGEVAFSDSGKGTRISGDYEGNSSRTVGVYPASDYSFAGWAKGSPSGEIVSTSSPYTFTVTEDVTLYALFEKITTYPVWVGETQVTSLNKDDILGDGGKAKFDPDSNTLTLNGLTLNGAYSEAAILVKGIDLTIVGSANVTNTSEAGISSPDPSSGGGITLNGDFTITGTTAIGSYPGVTVSGGTLKATATGTTSQAFSTYSPITISDGLEIIKPEGGKLSSDQRTIEDAAGNPATYVEIGPKSVTYPVWVGSVQVTEANKDDILGDGGKARFDPSTNTLTLNNPTISGETSGAKIFIYDNDKTYTIDGTATIDGGIVMQHDWSADLVLKGNITTAGSIVSTSGNITVDGNLTVSSTTDRGIYSGKSITIQSGTVSVTGTSPYSSAIEAGNVTISGGNVTATGGDYGILSTSYVGKILISSGTVTATATGNTNSTGIYAEGDITITGGEVTAKAGNSLGTTAIFSDSGDITISGGTVTAAAGEGGIFAYQGSVTVANGTTKVEADGGTVAVRGETGITIGDELEIREPVGGTVEVISSGSTNIMDGSDVARHVLIVPKEPLSKTHTVTFEANGGTPVPEAQTVADGGKATEPTEPTKPGVGFGGWYTDEFFTEVFDFNTPITGNITLYAKWIQYVYILEVVKVWEDDDDAAGKRPDSVDVKVLGNGTEVSTVTLTKDEEWKKVFLCASGEADLELTCEEIVPEGYTLKDMSRTGNTVTLTNQYIGASPVPTTYTVTFETNGGSAVASQTVNSGEKATKPADPTKSGFVFDGWYADATFAAAFDFDTPVTADVTVYAKWTEESKPGEIVYTIVSGGNSTWTKGSSSGVTIVVKRNPNNTECFSHFTSVQIDGTALVNGTDFSAVAGSTVITLNASALQKLTTGTKTVTINFDDGKATTSLIIKAGSSGTSGGTSPKTGDNSNPGLWITVMVLSGLGIGGLVVTDKKRRYVSRH